MLEFPKMFLWRQSLSSELLFSHSFLVSGHMDCHVVRSKHATKSQHQLKYLLLRLLSAYLLNARSQMWQMNGLRPRCFLLCLVSSSDLENLQPQSVHGQVKGLSPVWVLLWAWIRNRELFSPSTLALGWSLSTHHIKTVLEFQLKIWFCLISLPLNEKVLCIFCCIHQSHSWTVFFSPSWDQDPWQWSRKAASQCWTPLVCVLVL